MSALDVVLGLLQNRVFTLWTYRFGWTGYKKEKTMSGPWHYFNEKDDPLIVGLEPELVSKLDMARGKAGIPFVLSSGLRTSDQNASLSGSAHDSAHLPDANGLSQAVDLVCEDDHALWTMLFGLYMAGFRRMGVYVTKCVDNPNRLIPRHIHADLADDPLHPLEVIWVNIEQN